MTVDVTTEVAGMSAGRMVAAALSSLEGGQHEVATAKALTSIAISLAGISNQLATAMEVLSKPKPPPARQAVPDPDDDSEDITMIEPGRYATTCGECDQVIMAKSPAHVVARLAAHVERMH